MENQIGDAQFDEMVPNLEQVDRGRNERMEQMVCK
jgi:hypothetical protein